ncbi:unnamed protein product [Bursaphelenchus xylophilus]|uniref:(pine wood nematode) hypothetical protein n=1 Tax=Bursaphelenchus xylophilus TaxID=6326 RepID=A0A1I7SFE6_BURXY|nr:unnamed protein product [Bursaphelenchus xylophilus]CAG9092764.1 unnamed protein product [Bursaphelenchus xylophilus]
MRLAALLWALSTTVLCAQIHGCDFEIRIEYVGPVDQPLIVQIQEPNGALSPEFHFQRRGDTATYRVRGTCNTRTYIRVYKPSDTWTIVGRIFETSGVMTGRGYTEYKLLSSGLIFMHNSYGVPCVFGTWGTCVRNRFNQPLTKYDPFARQL